MLFFKKNFDCNICMISVTKVFFKYHMAPKPQLSVQYEAGSAQSEDNSNQSVSYVRILSKV